jgi:hypothetical protein
VLPDNRFGTGLPSKQDNFGKDSRDWTLAGGA